MTTLGQATTLLSAGIGAGVLNTVVGSGSLLPLTAMLGLGFGPVPAAIAVNVGLLPGGIAGAVGYRRYLPPDGRLLVTLTAAALVGAMLGAGALLVVPADAVSGAAPVCVVAASILVMVQPVLHRRPARGAGCGHAVPSPSATGASQPPRPAEPTLAQHSVAVTATALLAPPTVAAPPPPRRRRWLVPAVLAASAYGGSITAALGIVYAGALTAALGSAASLHTVNAIKITLCGVVSVAASMVFVVTDAVPWTPTLLIGAGTLVGGWLGAIAGQRLPPNALRGLLAATGLASASYFTL
ncbi:sulfite exporter TauE/SafE family protein [Actinomadura fulvescens]|uniref:Probable membrane transporter protein n=1 Tax=Actinomadura fulvescens TaxID=46160 RepID=A0ABN3QJ10_9ACTN